MDNAFYAPDRLRETGDVLKALGEAFDQAASDPSTRFNTPLEGGHVFYLPGMPPEMHLVYPCPNVRALAGQAIMLAGDCHGLRAVTTADSPEPRACLKIILGKAPTENQP